MLPHSHFLFAFLIAQVFVRLGFLDYKLAFIIAVLAVLVDFDHYLVFFLMQKKLNFKEFWNYTTSHDDHRQRTVIHKLPGFLFSLAISAALFFVNTTWLLIFAIPYFSHSLLDNLPRAKREKLRISIFGFVSRLTVYELCFGIALGFAVLCLFFI